MPSTLTIISLLSIASMPNSSSQIVFNTFCVPNTSWQHPNAFMPGNMWYNTFTHKDIGFV